MPFEQIPYTNFHGTNQDWMITQIKQMIADWASYRENLDAAWASYQEKLTGEWTDYQENINSWRQALDSAFNQLHDYVHDYFDNLDVQEEINNKLNQMVEDGTLDQLLLPYFNAYKTEINNIINTQNNTLNNQNNKISLLESEMDAFLQNHPATTGEKDAELVDIRVGYTGGLYPTAGDAVRGQIDNLSDDIENINEIFGFNREPITVIDGYNDANNTTTNNNNAPFIYYNNYDYTNCIIDAIELNIDNPGTLTIGVVKKSDIIVTEPFDRSNLIIKEVINITETGHQTISVLNKFSINNDEYLFIANNTDTATFKYGAEGAARYFYYVQSGYNDRVGVSNNSLGINVHCLKLITSDESYIRNYILSVYKDKKISILGDSISTFEGYIPEDNATYYPAENVTTVNDTWWKKLIDALGMELDVNNSWSGSRVTTTDGTDSAGCMTRCQNLGNPDVIIVWMGVNDFNNEVQLGTYNGRTALPSVTTTFREAYAIMLNKILTAYKTAEVWVCTMPQCERNAETGFPEINGNGDTLTDFNDAIRELANAFGVKVLEHDKCGLTYQNMPVYNPNKLHPNKEGHSLIANNDIRQMDNTISTRY